MTNPGQDYLPNTTETDIDGNVKELVPDPNGNYDGVFRSFFWSCSNIPFHPLHSRIPQHYA